VSGVRVAVRCPGWPSHRARQFDLEERERAVEGMDTNCRRARATLRVRIRCPPRPRKARTAQSGWHLGRSGVRRVARRYPPGRSGRTRRPGCHRARSGCGPPVGIAVYTRVTSHSAPEPRITSPDEGVNRIALPQGQGRRRSEARWMRHCREVAARDSTGRENP